MRSSIPFVSLLATILVASRPTHPLHQNTIRWIDCSKNVPESSSTFNASTINITSLPPTLHCGQLDVPMDYSKPFCDGNKITLGLAMVRPSNPKGALFL